MGGRIRRSGPPMSPSAMETVDSMPPPGRLSMEGAAKAQPLTARNHAMRHRAQQARSMPGRPVGAWVNGTRPAA